MREAQTAIQAMKRPTWPLFVAGVYARHGCSVDIAVLTLDRDVAAWAGRPITVGLLRGAMTITPTVIGPDQIPRITDPEVARRSPEMAVLSGASRRRSRSQGRGRYPSGETRRSVFVPPRTRRRWRARARTPASTVLHLLSALRRPALLAIVAQVGQAATRLQLLHAFRPLATALGALASLTILLNLALRGLRMM